MNKAYISFKQLTSFYTKRFMACMLFCGMLTGKSFAQDAETFYKTGNTYYTNRQFEEAEKNYLLSVQKEEKNVNALYNLGNTYYHLKKYPLAVLYYEKALKYAPGDKKIQHNIHYTNNLLFNKMTFSDEFFMSRWCTSFIHMTSAKQWTINVIILLWLGAALCLLYFFSGRKIFIRTGSIAFIIAAICMYAGYKTYHAENNYLTAIITAQDAAVKKEPTGNSGMETSVAAGTKVDILDMDKDWMKIKLPDGKSGWIEHHFLSEI